MILTEYVNSVNVNESIKRYLKDEKNFRMKKKLPKLKI